MGLSALNSGNAAVTLGTATTEARHGPTARSLPTGRSGPSHQVNDGGTIRRATGALRTGGDQRLRGRVKDPARWVEWVVSVPISTFRNR
jgi:hypothetical protein